MDESIIKRVIHKVQNKLTNHSKTNSTLNEYAFSSEELDELSKDNKEKIKELKKTKFKNTKGQILDEENLDESILNHNQEEEKEEVNTITSEEQEKDNSTDIDTNQNKISFINLKEDYQELIMKEWESISLNEIEKDILLGKDLLNHNYTITYADDAARFVHDIRKKYEIVLCYLIGFNNEKKGLPGKVHFGDNIDNEWTYLKQYIKILEKIKNFKGN